MALSVAVADFLVLVLGFGFLLGALLDRDIRSPACGENTRSVGQLTKVRFCQSSHMAAQAKALAKILMTIPRTMSTIKAVSLNS
jgi:hypothetical protein